MKHSKKKKKKKKKNPETFSQLSEKITKYLNDYGSEMDDLIEIYNDDRDYFHKLVDGSEE